MKTLTFALLLGSSTIAAALAPSTAEAAGWQYIRTGSNDCMGVRGIDSQVTGKRADIHRCFAAGSDLHVDGHWMFSAPNADGYVFIKSRATGFCLAGDDDYTYTVACDSGDTKQQWKASNGANGRWTLKNRVTSECMIPPASGAIDVRMGACTNGMFIQSAYVQERNIVVGGGTLEGRRWLSTRSDGSLVDLYTHEDGSGRQQWRIEPPLDGPYADSTEGRRLIVVGGVAGPRYLSATANGSSVYLAASDEGTGLQRWNFTRPFEGSPFFKIKPAGGLTTDNQMLSVPNEATVVNLYDHDDGTGHHRWFVLGIGVTPPTAINVPNPPAPPLLPMKFTFRNRSWCVAKIGVKPADGGAEVLTSGVSYGFDTSVSITTTAKVYVRSYCMGLIPGVYNEQGGGFTETAESGHEFAYKMTGTSDYARLDRD